MRQALGVVDGNRGRRLHRVKDTGKKLWQKKATTKTHGDILEDEGKIPGTLDTSRNFDGKTRSVGVFPTSSVFPGRDRDTAASRNAAIVAIANSPTEAGTHAHVALALAADFGPAGNLSK